MKYLKKSLVGKTPYYSKMITDGIILNANESAFKTPKKIMELFKEELDNLDLRRYPDTDNTIIREVIAKSYNIDIKNAKVVTVIIHFQSTNLLFLIGFLLTFFEYFSL